MVSSLVLAGAGCAGRDRVRHGPLLQGKGRVGVHRRLLRGQRMGSRVAPRASRRSGWGCWACCEAYARRQPRCRRAPHACPVLCALVVVAHDHESMGARPCDGDFSCPDRMLFYRCSGPLMPCDGGAHAPPERRLCGFEIWAFWSLSSLMKPSDLSSEIVSEIVQISVIVSRFQYV